MENQNNDFHISFFKPTTEQAKLNRNMVLWLVTVWAVAIFGFQIALRVLEKPTPEASYLKFEQSWHQVKSNDANQAELQDFSYACLSVLGKVFIKPEYKDAMDNGLSWAIYQLADSTQKSDLLADISNFDSISSTITEISDPVYLAAKAKLSEIGSALAGLEKTDVRTKILPLELNTSVEELSDEDMNVIEEGMNLYLIHNQSCLTDFKFLGFPFHYFYTAVFLLILFVGLCRLYCVRTDKMNKRLNIAD